MGIEANMEKVRRRIHEACRVSGRDPKEVRLIGVSKTKPVADMLSAYEAGLRDFGENYVQEVLEKAPELPEDLSLHFIGHLQTNKAAKLLPHICMLHSLDSLHLAEELEKQLAKHPERGHLPVLLEVNIAGEATKFGFPPEEVLPAVGKIGRDCPHLRLKGLMTSAPITEDPEANRGYFAAMKKLLLAANEMLEKEEKAGDPEKEPELLTELSMGMTGDYTVAIEEGATMVRVGTAIFGPRDYHR